MGQFDTGLRLLSIFAVGFGQVYSYYKFYILGVSQVDMFGECLLFYEQDKKSNCVH